MPKKGKLVESRTVQLSSFGTIRPGLRVKIDAGCNVICLTATISNHVRLFFSDDDSEPEILKPKGVWGPTVFHF